MLPDLTLGAALRRLTPRVSGARLLAVSLSLCLAACGGGGGGTDSSSASSANSPTVPASPTVNLSASPTTTTAGQVVSLTWSSSNTSSCTASGAWSGTLATSGTQAVTPGTVGTATYTITCGGVSSTANVTVNAAPATPTVSLVMAPANITLGQSATLSWSSTNASSCTASGAWSGSQATSGSLNITPAAAGTTQYTLNCSGGGGNISGSATLAVTAAASGSNTVSMVVDSGPPGANASNAPFVSVTVCQPGTSTCQTIDHVLVDTGSYGLRLLGPLNSALALPAVTTPSGAAAAECTKFVSGYTWGSVVRADVKLGGETASGMPIQVIGDTGSNYAHIPASCSNGGSNMGSVSTLGANGILGVGLFKQDCGQACAQAAVSGNYYACSGGSCTASAMPLAQQVSNPVPFFASDNNGVLLVLPTVSDSGASSLTGTLIFGVGTRSNNALGAATIYQADPGTAKNSNPGDFSTTYKGQSYPTSFIDSGSNGYFFNDSSLPTCRSGNGFYCPSSPVTLSATTASYDGSSSGVVSFTIVNESAVDSLAAALVGGTVISDKTQSAYFDWGLPFFFGRPVFVVFENDTAGGSAVTGPYWAY